MRGHQPYSLFASFYDYNQMVELAVSGLVQTNSIILFNPVHELWENW